MANVEEAIKRVPLFANLSKRDCKELASSMKERSFPAGTAITEIGEEGVGFFLIDSGTATVTINGREVRKLSSGDHFGEIALIDQGTRTANVTADTELRCWGLSSWAFRPFVQARPEVAWALLESLAQRVRENSEI